MAAVAGSVVSGVFASACCLGPLLLTVMGVSGAAMAHRFAPLRPYLLGATYGLLALAFYQAYRPRPACGPGQPCGPGPGLAARLMLWIGAALAVLATALPWYADKLY